MNRFVVTLLAAAAATGVGAAGEFINLGFDEPDLSRMYQHPQFGFALPAEDALRGWNFSFEWNRPPPPPEIAFIGFGGGAPFGLIGAFPGYGTWSLFVNRWYGAAWFDELRPTMHLYQLGRIPDDAAELWFWSTDQPPTSPVKVFVNDQEQIPHPVAEWWAHRGLKVSDYAGQEVTLEFVFPGDSLNALYSFDIRGFIPGPEPSSWTLVLLGGAALRLAGRKRRLRN
jgi:hypothetical protein